MKTGQKLIIAAICSVAVTLFVEFLNVQHYFNLDIPRYGKLLFYALSGQWSGAPLFYQEFVEQFVMLFFVCCEVSGFFFVKRGEN